MSPEQLAACTGANLQRATAWAGPLAASMERFGIDTAVRQAAFLANVGHESGRLVYAREIWGPTEAQLRYEGRRDLGNLRPGDGRKYLGRGLIQVTGRANYLAARDGMRKVIDKVPDFEVSPELMELPKWAAGSACWYWASRGLNAVADSGDFDGVCDIINRGRKTTIAGDSNGWRERLALWKAGKVALGVTS